MKNLSVLILVALCLIVFELHSQTLTNGLEMNSLYVEMDGKKTIEAHAATRMILPYNSTSIVLYQDDQYTYWAEFTFRQCGKKAKFKGKTYLELSSGEIIDGKSTSIKRKIEKGHTDWMVGVFDDSFDVNNKDDHALNAGFKYAMRFTN